MFNFQFIPSIFVTYSLILSNIYKILFFQNGCCFPLRECNDVRFPTQEDDTNELDKSSHILGDIIVREIINVEEENYNINYDKPFFNESVAKEINHNILTGENENVIIYSLIQNKYIQIFK